METEEKKFWDTFDPQHKECYEAIHKSVESLGWKSFVFAFLRYQKQMVKSSYQLLQTWK